MNLEREKSSELTEISGRKSRSVSARVVIAVVVVVVVIGWQSIINCYHVYVFCSESNK